MGSLRQKARRVVVACPAPVVWQWKNEVLDKLFALNAERAALERDATPAPP